MRYLGGKAHSWRDIVPIIQGHYTNQDFYLEPFVGSAWIMTHITLPIPRLASDANVYLIDLWKALQAGWIPPDNVTKAEYEFAKRGLVSNHLRGFIGFGSSFGGKWFAGYVSKAHSTNTCAGEARNSLLAKKNGVLGVTFFHSFYQDIEPHNGLIYCDPPYENTTQAYGTGDFDSSAFWGAMRRWSEDNTVLISSYSAPPDFQVLWESQKWISVKRDTSTRKVKIEKLFKYGG